MSVSDNNPLQAYDGAMKSIDKCAEKNCSKPQKYGSIWCTEHYEAHWNKPAMPDKQSDGESTFLESEFISEFRKLKNLRNNRHMDEPEFDERVEQLVKTREQAAELRGRTAELKIIEVHKNTEYTRSYVAIRLRQLTQSQGADGGDDT